MNNIKLKIQKLHKDAIIPTRSTETSIGIDLYALEDTIIRPGETIRIKTGIAIQPDPPNVYSLVVNRTSMAIKGLQVLSTIVEQDFRGHVIVCMMNTNISLVLSYLATRYTFPDQNIIKKVNQLLIDSTITIKQGDKIAQLLLHNILNCDIEHIDLLDYTEKGYKHCNPKNLLI